MFKTHKTIYFILAILGLLAIGGGLIFAILNFRTEEETNAAYLEAIRVNFKDHKILRDWQTYKSEQFGFELSIPKGWVMEEYNGGIDFISPELKAEAEQNDYNCQTDKEHCIPEFIGANFKFSNELTPIYEELGTENMTINGNEWLVHWRDGIPGSKNYRIEKDGKIYDFAVYNDREEDELLRKILYTIKFINNKIPSD
jgi:hypothetical protein